jgi:hypothetical protein
VKLLWAVVKDAAGQKDVLQQRCRVAAVKQVDE